MSDNEHDDQPKSHQGYHGWMKTIPKTGHDFTPIRIDAANSSTVTHEGSAWNAGGTWEERDKSEWAQERLKKHIMDHFHFTHESLKINVKASSIIRCEGDAKIVFSRGKKRCGYDIALKFEWESSRKDDEEGFNEAVGTVEIHDFDDTTGEEYDVKVVSEGTSQHATDAKRAVEQWEEGLRQILSTWKQELMEQ